MTRDGVPTVRATDDPRLMPQLRQELIDFAKHNGVWERSEVERSMEEVAGFGSTREVAEDGNVIITGPRGWSGDEIGQQITLASERARKGMEWYRQVCEDAQLVYVTADLVDVVMQAAAAVPDDLTLTLEDLPAPSGLVVLEKPIYGTDAGTERPGEPVRTDAIMWGTAKLPPADIDWMMPDIAYSVDSLTIGSIRWVAPDHDDILATSWPADALPLWAPMGRSDWPYNTPVQYRHRHDIPDVSLASMVEDRQFMAALFAVLNQRRLIEQTTLTPSRQQRRQAARKGNRHPDVVVVHLRRQEYTPTEGHDDGRTISVRFPVRPHFRRQPYGPGRKLRRIVLVPGHWKGPDGAPVKHAERVWSLDR